MIRSINEYFISLDTIQNKYIIRESFSVFMEIF